MPVNVLNLPTEATLQSIATALTTMQGNVSGVKGQEESTYRTGQVNLTPANIGALPSSTVFVSSVNGGSGAVTGIATQQELDEVRSIAEGAGSAISFATYASMVSTFNNAADDDYKVGQSVYINTQGVPDLWVYEVSDTQILYYYTTDAAFIATLKAQGYVQIGWYKLAALESDVNLSNYMTLDGTQTVTGLKSFTDFSLINDYTNGKTLASYLSDKAGLADNNTFTGTNTLGDLFINGTINKNNSSFGLSLPSTSGLTANSELLDTDSAQTISGVKTFSEIDFVKNQYVWKIINNGYNLTFYKDNVDYMALNTAGFVSIRGQNLGSNSSKWKDLYLSGKIKDGTNEFNADNVFNVINASAIAANNILTPEQLAIFTNGRFTRIIGDAFGLHNPTFFPIQEPQGYGYAGLVYCRKGIYEDFALYDFIIIPNTRMVYITDEKNFGIGYTRSASKMSLKGKSLPDYPTTNTSPQVLTIGENGGNLAFTDTPNKNLADKYDPTATYAVGDIVIYNNTLYKCNTAITTAEAWDDTHWTATTVSALVSDETIVKTNTNQTLSGTKTFNYFRIQENDNPYWTFIPGNSYFDIASYFSGALRTVFTISQTMIETRRQIRPNSNGTIDLGQSDKRFKDLYLSGNLSDGTNNVNISDLKSLVDYAKAQGWIS